jgi:hypothetical protein
MEREFLTKLKADSDLYYYYVSLGHDDKEFAKFYSFARNLKNYILYKQYESSLTSIVHQLEVLQYEVNNPHSYEPIKNTMNLFVRTAEMIMTSGGKPRPYSKLFS